MMHSKKKKKPSMYMGGGKMKKASMYRMGGMMSPDEESNPKKKTGIKRARKAMMGGAVGS